MRLLRGLHLARLGCGLLRLDAPLLRRRLNAPLLRRLHLTLLLRRRRGALLLLLLLRRTAPRRRLFVFFLIPRRRRLRDDKTLVQRDRVDGSKHDGRKDRSCQQALF
ncbi:MAG TPA: hypothetical protein VFP60_06265 [Pseudolabrys sp.]|nr:hypothetical protein [Pseudolabrys sp.]